jgi:hypothetical protein
VAEKNLMILCDTNIIIETLKGDDKTIKIIERIGLENISRCNNSGNSAIIGDKVVHSEFKRFQIHRWAKTSKIDSKFIIIHHLNIVLG